MDENLVGYLLGALDDGERAAVEASLHASPELRARLERIERALSPLADDAEAPAPPPGLVLATLARVAEQKCRKLPDAPPTPRGQAAAPRTWLRRPDVLVAALLLVVLGGLALSSLARLWLGHDRAACQNNLRLISDGLHTYCDANRGEFPRVETNGPHGVAAVFVPVLCDNGMLAPNAPIACPSQAPAPGRRPSVRELEELFDRDSEAFLREARRLAGGYAYTLGYVDEAGAYRGLRCDSGDDLPIMADGLESPAWRNSANHGGRGQNVLFLGGHVGWRTDRKAGVGGDDIYVNRDNQVLAGKDREDTVLGPGDASPTPPGKN